MDLPAFEHIQLDLTDAILTITLDRPERLNAINHALHQSIAHTLDFACDCEGARVVVLTGAGRAFSAGGDMSAISATAADFARESEYGRRIVQRLVDCEKPVICRLNGDAIGLGASLALLSDIVVADKAARIGDPHVRMGLVTFAVDAGELDARTDAIARKLAAGAPLAIKWTKRAINTAIATALPAAFEMSLGLEGVTMLSEDHAEAKAAFFEKRKPVFRGK